MHILLTRQLDDCSEMILKFKSLGHQVSHLPLLKIEKLNYNKIDKKIFCFCVGSMTEKKARSKGFLNVISAEGNVKNLKELILQNFDKKSGRLVYVSGETISVDLDKELVKEGYEIQRVVNYTSRHNTKFDETFVRDLSSKMPDIVYIYSQNSAASFLNFI